MHKMLVTGAALLSAGFVIQAEAATATFIISSPYLEFADSPFAALAAGNPNFHLETFEDGALDTLGASATAGVVIGPDPQADSVDGDDGSIDGSGAGGHSWYLGGVSSVTFSFDAGVLGALPTHVGVVWTDVGTTPSGFPTGMDDVLIRVFDGQGNSLGFAGADGLGDIFTFGGTSEDRFLGAIFEGGISKLQIVSLSGSTDWEVDHLQYGTAAPVPVPGAALLFGS
ncbi:MAG: hypothetical protein AB7I01_08020, partial [Gammaproteobacteria bacterium]